jgi:hypothetical protein
MKRFRSWGTVAEEEGEKKKCCRNFQSEYHKQFLNGNTYYRYLRG